MNIYKRKIHFKYLLFIGAVIIGASSLWYTNRLVEKIATEERKKIELWAKATNLIANYDLTNESMSFMLEVIQNNETVPVMIVDEHDSLRFHRNLDTTKIKNPEFIARTLQKMKEYSPAIEIDLGNNSKQHLYYNKSTLLTTLTLYPFVQLSVILLFILVAYLAFSSSRKAEQNQVWVGLSKETAHQLGTPISSLMAWKEILKLKTTDIQLISELDKDVTRLEKITERFSKIGSKPKLVPEDVNSVIESAVDYLKTRSSKNIAFKIDTSDSPLIVPLNVSLFEWVLENICKNSMDAIDGNGTIHISVIDNEKFVFIDITDNGKGIPRSRYKTIFKPGFTTKERGWGLGLSLSKRIVEEYHGGKIFVASSEIGRGTTIRITLNTTEK